MEDIQEYLDMQYVWKNEEDRYYKTPSLIKNEVLLTMSNSDIANIVAEKREEWTEIEKERRLAIKSYRGNNRLIISWFYENKQKDIEALARNLKYILRMRTIDKGDRIEISLQELKNSIPIIDVIESSAGIKIKNIHRLIRCPFPEHNDGTSSFKVYKNNTFYCFWCRRQWSQIDFLMNIYQIPLNEAIQKFTSYYR